MKLLFSITIFFFVTINICNGLWCIDIDEEIDISEDFTLTAVQEAIDDLKLTDQYDECYVIIFFNYDYKEIIIQSNMDFESDRVDTNYEVFFQTSIGIADDIQVFDKYNIFNIVEFACDYADECDRHFILDRIEWLLKVNYSKLESVIRPLDMNHSDNTERQCFDYNQKQKKLCPDGMCFVTYLMSSNSTNGECIDDDYMITELRLESYIITYPSNRMKQDEAFEKGDQIQGHNFFINYWCQTNNCNNPTIAESIIKAVKDHYDLSTLREVFKLNIEETTTTTTIDKSTYSTTTATATDRTTDSTTTIDKSTDSTTTDKTTGPTTTTDKSTDSTTTGKTTCSTTTEKPNNTSTSLHIFINMMIFIHLILIFHNFLF